MTGTVKKSFTVAKHKFTLEIYPEREGCHYKEGPYFEIFGDGYDACLYAFSNKEKINKLVKEKYL